MKKSILKKIVFTILSLILAYNSYKLLLIFFELEEGKFSVFAIIIAALAFSLLITGFVAFLGFVYPTSKLLPNTYFKIRHPKTLKTIYKWMGVEFFRFLLLKTFYREADNKKYFNGTKAGILLFDYNTKQSEFGHLIALLLVFVVSVILLIQGHRTVFFWIQPFNIILNFYPIILQRKHRIAVQRLMMRSGQK